MVPNLVAPGAFELDVCWADFLGQLFHNSQTTVAYYPWTVSAAEKESSTVVTNIAVLM